MRRAWTWLRPWLPALAIVLACVALGAVVAEARPGGGQGYSGPSSGGGGGGGGGDGEIVRLLIWLCIEHPVIGIPLLILFVVYTWKRKQGFAKQSYDSSPPPPPRRALIRRDIGDLARIDPEFSPVLFQDFAYRLFAAAHEASADPEQLTAGSSLSPYLSERARQNLGLMNPVGEPVAGVIVGSMSCVGLSMPDGPALDQPGAKVLLTLDFEANMTIGREATQRGVFVHERWTLERAATARSKPPGENEALGCPSCGAPFRSTEHETCEYCGEVVGNGRFDWLVTSITRKRAQVRPPSLVSHVAEQGTSRPTVLHPQRRTEWADLVADDPAVDEDGLAARAALIFRELNEAWSKRDLRPARPFVSDGLASYLDYWIRAYRAAGLANRVEDARLTGRMLARVQRDKWYDAVTLRLWAEGKDYTVQTSDGKVVSGSARKTRRWSEYWTLIRRRSARGEARLDSSCPNCGGPLEDMAMSGECRHCGSHVTGGEFDWVLSRIEQDEAYVG